ncbi:hypothetical protein A3D77_06610 [Candidatus Gottesmanbacteria bacterium RIFCSPHIGHO2_02_FULL_39_11]|uniref:Uncharacterized protein n=1 Tax=Candidatus Gottesmanbacteria bacterium RIFCSPHIGHO2_02_FULL_39_11 TaxID=1798382 RepID=A0A1F5ZSN8_9BACT|nr:MAG: hypothetical protein A3D77_06610 [Candidatus Gottesmanbacteria bacterium RIFCSPHIGHO2_02_FULL_39_11]
MNTTVLQIPMSKDLRTQAEKEAEKQGFFSLQEVVRVLLNRFSAGHLFVTFKEPAVTLSPKNAKRYEKMSKDVRTGKVKTKSFTNVEDMMAYLHDH